MVIQYPGKLTLGESYLLADLCIIYLSWFKEQSAPNELGYLMLSIFRCDDSFI